MHEPHHERRPFWYLGRRRPTVEAERSTKEAGAPSRDAGPGADRARSPAGRGAPPRGAAAVRRSRGDATVLPAGGRAGRRGACSGGWCSTTSCRTCACQLRGLRRAPLITAVIIATVGLGIGATTVAFAAIHATSAPPAPVRRAGAPRAASTPTRLRTAFRSPSPTTPRCRRSGRWFEQIAGCTGQSHVLQRRRRGGAAARPRRDRDLLRCSGSARCWARDFTESDGRPGTGPAVIVSHGFWQRRLSARADVIGRVDSPSTARRTRWWACCRPGSAPLEQGQRVLRRRAVGPPRRKGRSSSPVLGRFASLEDRAAAADEIAPGQSAAVPRMAGLVPGREGLLGDEGTSRPTSRATCRR